MRIKSTACFFLSILGQIVYSQLLITEVYYNTPYNEKLYFNKTVNGVLTGELMDARKHHRGEFIEIYNYSDKDVNLKNWYLKDLLKTFWLPEKIIKKGEFMVIAYSTLPYNTTIFSEHFSTTAGKENQIIYQDDIILRNKREEIILGYSFNRTNLLNKSKYSWEFQAEPSSNFIKNIYQNPSQFYSFNSLQYNPTTYPNGKYEATPNPLAATYVPTTQSYDEIIKDDFQQYYSYLDWSDNVNTLVDKICSLSIEKVSQSPNGSYTNNGSSCFSYDSAGNLVTGGGCNGASTPSSGTPGVSSDELELIKNNIIISPNPTKASDSYNVTITWNGPALNKINNIQIFNSSGTTVYGFSPGTGVNTTTFNLQNQLPGAFVANFILNTGQIVSKNILKW
ncbi:lamin tail domain-containing protein [Chryseobacterium herbae]|uniref:Lamin tail domain-containing protein n=1 Tax=Chryseobacterium herbae TaxID=2976476 RepID=A0ABT2ITV5_9FLAO|nr:lamin tail domain-containing protein [Chryseobacterium sp. pc1-10]MCT2562276.1 lamin tail domain-containing protein [Chryseobacterium sp. pc1-10]